MNPNSKSDSPNPDFQEEETQDPQPADQSSLNSAPQKSQITADKTFLRFIEDRNSMKPIFSPVANPGAMIKHLLGESIWRTPRTRQVPGPEKQPLDVQTPDSE